MDISFHLHWVNTEKHNCWLVGKEYVKFCRKLPDCLPKWLCHFAFPPAVNECSHRSTCSPARGTHSLLDLGRSNRCVVVSHRITECFWRDCHSASSEPVSSPSNCTLDITPASPRGEHGNGAAKVQPWQSVTKPKGSVTWGALN